LIVTMNRWYEFWAMAGGSAAGRCRAVLQSSVRVCVLRGGTQVAVVARLQGE
jgi:hypothetical protein